MSRAILIFALLSACSTSQVGRQDEASTLPAVWDIEFVDNEQKSLGSVRLGLTAEPVDEDYCGGSHYRRATVLRDDLKIELHKSLQPVWHVFAYGLSIDLTSSTCNTNYVLIGSMNREAASGYFNYAHPLGGSNIGRFTAVPVLPAEAGIRRLMPVPRQLDRLQ